MVSPFSSPHVNGSSVTDASQVGTGAAETQTVLVRHGAAFPTRVGLRRALPTHPYALGERWCWPHTNIRHLGVECCDLVGGFCGLGVECCDLVGGFCGLGVGAVIWLVVSAAWVLSAVISLAVWAASVDMRRCLEARSTRSFLEAEFPRKHDEKPSRQQGESGV